MTMIHHDSGSLRTGLKKFARALRTAIRCSSGDVLLLWFPDYGVIAGRMARADLPFRYPRAPNEKRADHFAMCEEHAVFDSPKMEERLEDLESEFDDDDDAIDEAVAKKKREIMSELGALLEDFRDELPRYGVHWTATQSLLAEVVFSPVAGNPLPRPVEPTTACEVAARILLAGEEEFFATSAALVFDHGALTSLRLTGLCHTDHTVTRALEGTSKAISDVIEIVLGETAVTEHGVARLQRVLPNARITHQAVPG